MFRSSERMRTRVAETWIRNAQIALYAFMSVAALTGLGYVFYCALAGPALGAIQGALIAIGGVTCGCVALALLRFGEIILMRAQEHDALLARVEALESAFESQGVPIDLARVGPAEADGLVAANLDHDVFPRLVKPAGAAVPEAAPEPQNAPAALELQWQSAYQEGDLAACRRTLESLRTLLAPARVERLEESLRMMSQSRSAKLREDFARLVRLRNYEAAMAAGDEIERLFPNSEMAREFRGIRPHLERRAEDREPAQHAPAI